MASQALRQLPKSHISIQPLDTTISLPAKMANLDLTSIYPPEGSLQAYQPTREGEFIAIRRPKQMLRYPQPTCAHIEATHPPS